MAEASLERRIAAVRRFNRFFTRRIGVLGEGLLDSPFSLAEARVLYELAHRVEPTATDLGKELGLDAGYLSRILRRFEASGLIVKTPSTADARQSLLRLTAAGREAFAPLDTRSHDEIGEMLAPLTPRDQDRLVGAMAAIEQFLGAPAPAKAPYLLRPHRPGDIGWVIAAHGALYAREFGWDERFEAMVAHIAAKYIETEDPKRERCWIAEMDGEPVGSVFVVAEDATTARLRLLIVEPRARGLGIGARLVEECIRYAEDVGYRRMVLWTQSILVAARRIYEAAGFRLERAEPHRSFGQDLVGETWSRDLGGGAT